MKTTLDISKLVATTKFVNYCLKFPNDFYYEFEKIKFEFLVKYHIRITTKDLISLATVKTIRENFIEELSLKLVDKMFAYEKSKKPNQELANIAIRINMEDFLTIEKFKVRIRKTVKVSTNLIVEYSSYMFYINKETKLNIEQIKKLLGK